MITPTPIQTTQQLPLHCFFEELRNLHTALSNPEPHKLQPFVKTSLESLLTLRESAEQLPDLSASRWFLHAHYHSARNQTLENLRIAKNHLMILSVKADQGGDVFNIIPFTAGFMSFAERAMTSPVVFQQPYEHEFALRIPEPPPASLSEVLADLSLDAQPGGPM